MLNKKLQDRSVNVRGLSYYASLMVKAAKNGQVNVWKRNPSGMKNEVLVTSSSHLSDLASRFLNFSDIPHTNAEIISPMDVHVHHEVLNQQTPTLLTVHVSVIIDIHQVTTLEKEVVELKKDPLKTQVIALVDEYLDIRLGATRDEFMRHLSASITARIIEQVKNQLP
ncbi:hypothetical protein Tco_0811106 [Tanacetum coccineum]